MAFASSAFRKCYLELEAAWFADEKPRQGFELVETWKDGKELPVLLVLLVQLHCSVWSLTPGRRVWRTTGVRRTTGEDEGNEKRSLGSLHHCCLSARIHHPESDCEIARVSDGMTGGWDRDLKY